LHTFVAECFRDLAQEIHEGKDKYGRNQRVLGVRHGGTQMSWAESEYLEKTFTFENFGEALAFVNRVGALAEQADHHPDITIHDYKQVSIKLITHDQGKVTHKDHSLAKEIDEAEDEV